MPTRVSFRHLYFSPDRRATRARDDAVKALAQLAGQPVDAKLDESFADPFMFQEYYRDRGTDYLGKEFGPQFAQAVAKLPIGSWQGPIESGFGWHLVFVDTAIPGHVPDFEEVEPDVKTAWLSEQKALAWEKTYQEMRAKYTVLLPKPPENASAAPAPSASSRLLPGWGCSDALAKFQRMIAGIVLALLFAFSSAQAHEIRPAYLELKETAPGQFSVLWRTPVMAGMRLPVVLKLPDDVRNLRDPVVQELTDSLVERRWIEAGPHGLAGKRIEFPGLQLTITDVLVRLKMLDGQESTTLVHPSQPWFEVDRRAVEAPRCGRLSAPWHRTHLGGIDHLLFILALMILVKGTRRLVATVTAFTVAHSITLAGATLGFVHVPQQPVEACIALSIVFVAGEIVHARQGWQGWTERWPWIVAFTFGLLHGFGFAGALNAVGLPQTAIPVALLFFNVGVEIGQLLFIAAILSIMALARWLIRRTAMPKPAWAWRVAPYSIGGVAAFWMVQRIAAF